MKLVIKSPQGTVIQETFIAYNMSLPQKDQIVYVKENDSKYFVDNVQFQYEEYKETVVTIFTKPVYHTGYDDQL